MQLVNSKIATAIQFSFVSPPPKPFIPIIIITAHGSYLFTKTDNYRLFVSKNTKRIKTDRHDRREEKNLLLQNEKKMLAN